MSTAQGWERFGAAHVPGCLGHLELLGILVGILVVQGTVRLLVLMHPLLVCGILDVLLLKDLKENKVKIFET